MQSIWKDTAGKVIAALNPLEPKQLELFGLNNHKKYVPMVSKTNPCMRS